MKRVLIVHPRLDPPGGSNGVAAWFIEALKRDHRVTFLTWVQPSLAAVNGYYGTALGPADFECRMLPAWPRRMFRVPPFTLALAKDSFMMRHARGLAAQYDLLISTSGEHDLGGPGLQYVHYPRLSGRRPDNDLGEFYHRPLPIRLYRSAVLRLSGTSVERVRANRTLANSEWVAEHYRRVLGAPAETLYPPAVGPFVPASWDERQDGIVCIGRLSPEKRIELVIEIVDRLRARGHALRLHIVGSDDNPVYAQSIRRLLAERPWITLHQELPRGALCELIASQRYGLHGMEEEHFGMAVAELVSAGCIVFVPDGGGQREIVGADPRLLFRDAEEGADRIAAVLTDPALQADLRRALAPRAAVFAPEYFTARVRSVVAECLA